MGVCCKKCGKEIDYKFNPIKSSGKIKCKNCKTIYKLNDINHKEYVWFWIRVVLIASTVMAVQCCNFIMNKILVLLIFLEIINFVQYVFIEHSVITYGFKDDN